VPAGQWEAARALGMGRLALFWKVVMPQAAIVALRPLGNEIILMIKGSAVASIVTVFDLMGETRLAFSRSYNMAVYLQAAVLYLIIVETIRRLWNRLDARLDPSRPASCARQPVC
jgi:polar amino acid transport system permease protein